MNLKCVRVWCLSMGLLQAQSVPEVLDVVPPGAMIYLFAKSPLLIQTKLQGLSQRLGIKERDPLTLAQERFGLKRLPVERRGMALVYAEVPGPQEVHPLVFLAVKDPDTLLAELKAVPGEQGLYRFKVQGAERALALREGWVILGGKEQIPALRKAAKERGGLRSSMGGFAAWLEARDAAGVFTSDGLWSVMQAFRKKAGAAWTHPSEGAENPTAKIEQFFAQAQREIRHVGFGAEVDEHGGLKGVLRVQLQPGGQWAQMAAGLEEVADFGLGGLKGERFMMAMGGALPKAWMTEASLLFFNGPLFHAPLSDPAQLDHQQAIERIARQVRGLHMAVCPPPEGLQQVLRVEDAEAYLLEQDAFWKMASARPGAPMKIEPRRIQVDGHEALALVTALPDEMAAQMKELPADTVEAQRMALQRPISTFIKLDPRTLAIRMGEAPSGPSGRAEAPALKDAEVLRGTVKLLPDHAHFFAFIDLHGAMDSNREALQKMESKLTEEQRRDLPPLPEREAFPSVGMALRYEEDAWELHLALPWETQVGIAHQEEDKKAVMMRAMAAQQAFSENGMQGAPPEAEEPREE